MVALTATNNSKPRSMVPLAFIGTITVYELTDDEDEDG